MNWEALTAIGTMFTGLVILITVIFARRQLELTRNQLEHLRRTTQLEGATAVFTELDSPRQLEGRRFVRDELAARMKDPIFRGEVRWAGLVDETQHKELIVLRFFERIGVYVNAELIDEEIVFNLLSGRIVSMWDALREVVAIHREALGPVTWKNFERLQEQTMRWQEQQSSLALQHFRKYQASKEP